VSNIWDSSSGGHHVKYGAQIADHITMGVSAVAIAGTPAPMEPCLGAQKKQAKEKEPEKAEEVDGEAVVMKAQASYMPQKEGWKLHTTRRYD
jgi:hypothetical protein